MKKKQLFAVLLAGSMTVGMAPAAAFAAEDTGAAAQTEADAQTTDENTDTAEDSDAAAAEAEAQKKAEEEQAAAEAEAQKQAEEQAAAEAEAQKKAEEEQAAAEAEAQKQAEEQAAAEAEAQKQAEEQAAAEAAAKEAAEKGTVVTDEAGLIDAIKAAAEVDTSSTTVAEAEPVKIVISGTIELTDAVKIPANKSIALFGKDEKATIKRADSYKGNLFEVSANSAFYMAKKDATDEDPTEGTLTVDGSLSDGSAVAGSLVHIVEGASFSMTTGVTLKNNVTDEKENVKGAAIFNEGGNVLLTGGTITGNKCDNGAVYSTGTISVRKGDGAADTEPSVTENTKTDGKTSANIVLSGEGKIEIKGAITDQAKLGFSVEDPKEGYEAITGASDASSDDVTAALKILASQYEGDTTKFTVDETTGKLAAVAEEPTPTPTTSVEPTATPKTTTTPKPTKKPTVTPKPVDIKWTAFEWTSHDSASVTLRSSVSGTCYYTWVERGDDGTSSTPKKAAIKNKQAISKDKNFTIYLNDLDTDKAIDLYFYIKPSKGTESGIKKVKLDQTKRPTKGHTPVVPKVTESIVKGLSTNMEFYPNTFYPFEVIGAGTTNKNPGEGDAKWEPLYWSTSSNPKDSQKHSTWKIGSTTGISKGQIFSLYVFFQKYVYTGGEWTATDTISSARYEFGSVPITITPSAGAGANGANGSGGQAGSDPDATVTGAASATSSNGGNGTTSKSAVSTADNSPIGTMSALAVASILAGGYVIVRRRKKDI